MIGDINDIVSRLLGAIPSNWIPKGSPILTAIMQAPGSVFASIYSHIQYVKQQARIATATDSNLDIIAYDYFQNSVNPIARLPGEQDTAFRARIRANLLLPRGTRESISNAVLALTGTAPTIVEPRNADDTGGYGTSGSNTWTGLAYNYAGAYGSRNYPYQMFLTATRSNYKVNPASNVNGYNGYLGGYGSMSNPGAAGRIEYASGVLNTGSFSDADIYAAVAANKPAGTIVWVALVTP